MGKFRFKIILMALVFTLAVPYYAFAEISENGVPEPEIIVVEPETIEEIVEDEPSEETKVVEEAQEVVEPVETAEVLDDQPKVEEYNNAKEEEVIIPDGEMTLEKSVA